MLRHGSGIVVLASLIACGGGDTTRPSPSSGGVLEGAWRGTLTVYTPTPQTAPITMAFQTIPLTLGAGFNAQASWMGTTTRALNSTLVGTQFSIDGVYPSRFGCDGDVWSLGTADAHTIDATFNTSSACEPRLTGHITLTR